MYKATNRAGNTRIHKASATGLKTERHSWGESIGAQSTEQCKKHRNAQGIRDRSGVLRLMCDESDSARGTGQCKKHRAAQSNRDKSEKETRRLDKIQGKRFIDEVLEEQVQDEVRTW